MITPLDDMVAYIEQPVVDVSQDVDCESPEPIIDYYTSTSSDVKSVGDGVVVGMYDDAVIIKTTITRQISVGDYKIATKVVELDDGSYDCEWVTPKVKPISNTYYITYYGLVSDLMIGDAVAAGDIIGVLLDTKLGISVTLDCGIDVGFSTLI